MIRTFSHKGLEQFFLDGTKKGIQPAHAGKVADILDRLNAAVRPQDMDYPGSNLHPLKGNLKGHWSVKVSGNWRVTFRWEDGDACDLDYVDYH